MKTVRIEYYGMEGSGRNVTEAKKDASQKLTAAIRGSYEPLLLTLGDHQQLIWRHPRQGWTKTIITDGSNGCATLGYGDRLECENHARLHMAQNHWDFTNDRECLEFIHDAHDKREFERWVEWQRQYKELINSGVDDMKARELIRC